ncbi:hypothetical protein A9Q84_12395 [Halobacteriovorax marinus]|uniref:VWFA domain-containing protein n=1 Tax=Halobacteriovorax marinus TaxID=97084 RepID=A0A1Y5FEW1_9BACT|nr:hypothetical protein A9Q84_12395 [Halobacteriovorax marinus]
MVFSTTWVRNSICLVFIMMSVTSCNEQEFYEKKFLNGAGVADKDIPSEVEIPTDSNNGGGTTTPAPTPTPTDPIVDNGGNNGGGTTTPTPTDPIVDNGGNNGGGTTTPTPTDPIVDNGGNNGGGTTTPTPTDPVIPTDPVVPTEPTINYKTIVENFTQATAKKGKVDILWVVDDSGSMGDEQKALAYNFDVFIHEFLEKKIDFQMAITTTDATSRKDGKLICSTKLLTTSAALANEKKFVSDFAKCIKVGTRGSGRERGLHTSKSFIEKNSQNWMRDDAYLVVVYVSDEEDQSYEKVSHYVDYLKSKKEKSGLIKLYSIVSKEKTSNRWETVGTRYLAASEKTGGNTAHIKNDFYKTLREMGGKIVDLIESFALSQVPHKDKVEIKVNGTAVSTGYSYDNQARTVKFLQGHIPNEGSNVEVTYSIVSGELN